MSPLASPYAQLISAVCDEEPHLGWLSGADLPALTRDDMRVVLDRRGDDVRDGLILDPADLRAALASSNPIGALGVLLNAAIERACREAMWNDVFEECEVRDEQRALPESTASRLGVASLFRGSQR